MKRALAGIVLLWLLLGTGCKTGGGAAFSVWKGNREQAVTVSDIEQHALRFETLSARMSVEGEWGGKEMHSRIDLKMVWDSVLVLSVQPLLGMEMLRIRLTADSVTVIDRINQRYVSDTYEALLKHWPAADVFNFYHLQALLANRLFLPDGVPTSPEGQKNRFLLRQDGNLSELRTRDAAGRQYTFTAEEPGRLLSVHIAAGSALQWTYSRFEPLPVGRDFPTQMKVTAPKTSVQISLSHIATDIPVQTDAKVTSKYNRTTLKQLIDGVPT